MKKLFLVVVMIVALSAVGSAQQYWHLKTSLDGRAAVPADSNGMALGYGLSFTFGRPGGTYDIGFEIAKWSRKYNLYNALIDSVQAGYYESTGVPEGKTKAENRQRGLAFSTSFRYRFIELSSYRPYFGAGGGFYFIRVNREEARPDPLTGVYSIDNVDYYLDTKGQSFFLLGLDANFLAHTTLYLEGRATYIFDFERWDHPYIFSGGFGLQYQF